MDYLVADREVIPESERAHYAEEIIYLPDTFLPFDIEPPAAERPARDAAGLPAQGFVFCGFNAALKITPEVFASWMRILVAVPGAVLWLREGPAGVRRN